MNIHFNFVKPIVIILREHDTQLGLLHFPRLVPTPGSYLISYQSQAQLSMHRIPGSLNGPNKAIVKHLEIFRGDTDNPRPAHGNIWDELWHDTALDYKADTNITSHLTHLIVVFTERVMVSVIDS